MWLYVVSETGVKAERPDEAEIRELAEKLLAESKKKTASGSITSDNQNRQEFPISSNPQDRGTLLNYFHRIRSKISDMPSPEAMNEDTPPDDDDEPSATGIFLILCIRRNCIKNHNLHLYNTKH